MTKLTNKRVEKKKFICIIRLDRKNEYQLRAHVLLSILFFIYRSQQAMKYPKLFSFLRCGVFFSAACYQATPRGWSDFVLPINEHFFFRMRFFLNILFTKNTESYRRPTNCRQVTHLIAHFLFGEQAASFVFFFSFLYKNQWKWNGIEYFAFSLWNHAIKWNIHTHTQSN